MAIGLLLAGMAVVSGAVGIGGHINARETNERAERKMMEAQELYDEAEAELNVSKENAENALLKLGYQKKSILDSSMRRFLAAYDKIKHIQVVESIGINELSKFTIKSQDELELRKITNIYSSSIQSGAAGAATGAIVALAASGSLPIVAGGLTTAGTALAAGEIGLAAGVAGSALSFGAAMTPLAAVAAPVIMFTGLSASAKADENMERARAMYAEARAAAEEMRISITLCNAIVDKSNMLNGLVVELNKMFTECSNLLEGVVRTKEGRFFKKTLTSESFTEDELKLIAVTRALAGAIKAVIDTPILTNDGNLAIQAQKVYDQTQAKIPDFKNAVQEVRNVDYDISYDSDIADKKVVSEKKIQTKAASEKLTVFGITRCVVGVILGVYIATKYSLDIAEYISDSYSKFLFLDSIIVNVIGVWLLIFSNIAMFVGKFRGTKGAKVSGFCSGLALFILYVQYCRTMEELDHYIIKSLIIMVVSVIVWFVLSEKKWNFAGFIASEAGIIIFLMPLFLIYILFGEAIGISKILCLVVTSVLALVISMFGMMEMQE